MRTGSAFWLSPAGSDSTPLPTGPQVSMHATPYRRAHDLSDWSRYGRPAPTRGPTDLFDPTQVPALLLGARALPSADAVSGDLPTPGLVDHRRPHSPRVCRHARGRKRRRADRLR